MKVSDIISVIEEFAPVHNQEKWDNCGLCIGSEDDETRGVLIGLDCTEDLVDEAVARGADMIVTHHPLIFGGLKKISPSDPVGAAVIKAVRNGIAVYCAHTSADKVPAGVSGAMAERLGLVNVNILDQESEGVGLGVIGEFPEAMGAEEAVALVKERFNLRYVRCSRLLEEPVKTVAMCGGAGSSLIGKAMEKGAQLYLSGDISYHHFSTPKGFMLMDVGHYESEIGIVDILFSLIRKKFPNFAVLITQNLNSNPIFYF